MADANSDVVVIGAGPTGLLVAGELARAGVQVEVLERLDAPDRTIKAGSVNVASAEILDRRGLLPRLQEAQRAMLALMQEFAGSSSAGRSWRGQLAGHSDQRPDFPVTGHFAGMLFRSDLVDQADPVLAAHTAVADGTLVAQRDVETILGEHADHLGVRVHRGVEVRGLHSAGSAGLDDPDADVVIETDAGDRSATWVVGTDGGRSLVRHAAGIAFPGTDPETIGYQAIVDIDRPELLSPGWSWSRHGVYSYGPIPGRILLVQFTGAPVDRDTPVTLDELEASLRLVSGTDVTLTALHGRATRWTDNARQAETYRSGRVLLAGDAAHVHSPFSGQGLNLGLGDATNLGWKLAATVRGWAPEHLLDTYTSERHPIGAWVLDWTRAQVALMRGDDKTAQLRRVVADDLLSSAATTTRMVELTSGIAQTYAVDDTPGDTPDDALVGRLVRDIPLRDGGRLADHAHDGRFLLLDRTADRAVAAVAEPWGARLSVVPDARTADGPTAVLVRPDGVVVWALDDAHDEGEQAATDRLRRALARWAGAPAGRAG